MAGQNIRRPRNASNCWSSPATTASPRAASPPGRRKSRRRWSRISPPGGAAANRLCEATGAVFESIPLALDSPTADFTAAPAMSETECAEAFGIGFERVDAGVDLLCLGEMGIGNSTAAAALCLALFGGGAADWTGRGAGVDDAGLARKRAVVAQGVERHRAHLGDPAGGVAAARRARTRRLGRRRRRSAPQAGSGGARRFHLLRRRGGAGARGAGRARPLPGRASFSGKPRTGACSRRSASTPFSTSVCAWAKVRARFSPPRRSRPLSPAPRRHGDVRGRRRCRFAAHLNLCGKPATTK